MRVFIRKERSNIIRVGGSGTQRLKIRCLRPPAWKFVTVARWRLHASAPTGIRNKWQKRKKRELEGSDFYALCGQFIVTPACQLLRILIASQRWWPFAEARTLNPTQAALLGSTSACVHLFPSAEMINNQLFIKSGTAHLNWRKFIIAFSKRIFKITNKK